jgi:hypothetical protein
MCCGSAREASPNVNCLPHSVSMVVKVRGILFSAAIRWKGELCSAFGITFSVHLQLMGWRNAVVAWSLCDVVGKSLQCVSFVKGLQCAAAVYWDKGSSRAKIIVFLITVYITVHCCSGIIAHLFPLFLPDRALSVGSGYVRFVCVEFSIGSIWVSWLSCVGSSVSLRCHICTRSRNFIVTEHAHSLVYFRRPKSFGFDAGRSSPNIGCDFYSGVAVVSILPIDVWSGPARSCRLRDWCSFSVSTARKGEGYPQTESWGHR